MNRNTQKNNPLFTEVNIRQRVAESRNRSERHDMRFSYIKPKYPNPEWAPNTDD